MGGGIAPDWLIGAAGERVAACFRLGKQGGEGHAETAADLVQELSSGAGFAALDAGEHGAADVGLTGKSVEGQVPPDSEMVDPGADAGVDVGSNQAHIFIIYSIIMG